MHAENTKFGTPGGEVTLKDVARAAGVSVSTASRVLAKVAGFVVKQETQERIVEVARRLNYRNNTMAKTLRTKKSNFIGVFLQDVESCILPKILNGIHEGAASNGYQVVVHCNTDGVALLNTACDWITECRIDGMIFSTALLVEEQVQELESFGQPYVVLSHVEGAKRFVCADDKQGLTVLVRHLKDLGHRDIALLCGPAQASPFGNRINCFREVLEEEGLPYNPDLIVAGGWGAWQDGSEGLHRLRLKKVPFTAVIGGTVNLALGTLSYAVRSGLRVPEDLSIASFHDAQFNEMPATSITAVRMPLSLTGNSAAAMLHRCILREEGIEPIIVSGAELVVRESTGPVPPQPVSWI